MQLLLSRSKLILSAVLSFGILLALPSDNIKIPVIEVTGLNFTETLDHSAVPTNSLQPVVSFKSVSTVWDSISRDLKLDHKAQTSQVKAEIRKLLADQEKFYQILKAASPYIYFIHKQTQARGLPAELALIPVIESEFNPNDHSNKGATGLWQIMPQTARGLGVKVKSSYDGRRNVIASTKAALAYFNDLGNYFNGNWYLAIAAYNCGQFKIHSAERRTGSNNFFNLPLPRETKYYVPKLLAVAAIVENPVKYGVTLPPINNTPYFSELKIKKAVNLESLAKSTGISIDVMRKLNPDYNHHPIANQGSYILLVPIMKESVVREKLAGNVIT